MPDRRTPSDGGSRLSLQTLIVASLASLTAAIVVSTFWQGGTPIAAAITPVIVAVASELYSRPARRISALSARAAERTRARTADGAVRRPVERTRVGGPPSQLPEREPLSEPEGVGPIRVYRSESSGRRRIHLKVALATAAVAFVIAAAVLTVPELVFGGSVASHGKTTFFGGSTHKSKSKRNTQTSPSSTSPSSTAPTQSQTTTAPPAQTVPQTTTPSAPPSGTTGGPQGTSTPAQSGQ
jgi:hypothetical protein